MKQIILILCFLCLSLTLTLTSHNQDSSSHSITQNERDIFGIGTDDPIKELVKTYFGRKPDNVFLKDPTSWGNTFSQYGWAPVISTLTPIDGSTTDASITLSGSVFVNYNTAYKGHHFWDFSINSLLNAGSLSTTQTVAIQ
jgi:hypothetical protein